MIAHEQSHLAVNRRLRPVERQPMREWLLDLLDSNVVPSLSWLDKGKREFRIKWCHGSRHGWSLKDADLFERWANHTGRYYFGGQKDPKRWKANFRCALNSLKTIEEVRDKSFVKGSNACRIYRIKDDPRKDAKFQQRQAMKSAEQIRATGVQQQSRIKHEPTKMADTVPSQMDTTPSQMDFVVEEKQEIKPDAHTTSSPQTLTASPSWTDCKMQLKSVLPNFDKISPGIDRIEFGKQHSIPNHSCGFIVKMITPDNSKKSLCNTSQPLPPGVSTIKISLPESFQAQIAGASSSTPTTVLAPPQYQHYQYQPYRLPESPEASDASPQSAMQDEELVEVNLYEVSEEVTISTQGTEESHYTLPDISQCWQHIDDQDLVTILTSPTHTTKETSITNNTCTYQHSPLTPP